MSLSDYVVSLIRTLVPGAVAAAFAWLATKSGLVLDEQSSATAILLVTGTVLALYYGAVRKLEERWPSVGKWLLGLGITRRTPVYAEPDAIVHVDGETKR